jgi:fructose-1,6-bisphosphatase I
MEVSNRTDKTRRMCYSNGACFLETTAMSDTVRPGLTLLQHISHQQRSLRATGEFSAVLTQIATAGKVISSALANNGLFERVGNGGGSVASDSSGKRLDFFAQETFNKIFSNSPWISTLITSEDLVNPLKREHGGKYVVFVDCLDGANNLDVNGAVGSIFSVYRRPENAKAKTFTDLLFRGSEQVAAGYILYGPSTVLVYSSGEGVNEYTLDPGSGEFLVTREKLHIPERGLTYSCNEAHMLDWTDVPRRFVEHLRTRDPRSNMYYSTRYSGSMIPDIHRTLLEGGVYLVPGNIAIPGAQSGKRFVMFECKPLAFLFEQAGGTATNGRERILKIQPETLEQRCEFVIGSHYEVLLYEDFAQGKR